MSKAATNVPATNVPATTQACLPANVTEDMGAAFGWDNPLDYVERVSLPRISFSKDAPLFKMPDESFVPALEGHLLCAPLSPRRYYAGAWSTDQHEAPDCSSSDGVKPDPQIERPESRTCVNCEQNQWGSSTRPDGSQGKGKACRQYRRHVLMMDDSALPFLFDVSPLGLQAVDQFLVRYATNKEYSVVVNGKRRPIPLQLARLKITLEARKAEGGSAMVPVYEVVGWADPEKTAELAAAKAAFVDQAMAESVVEEVAESRGRGEAREESRAGSDDVPF